MSFCLLLGLALDDLETLGERSPEDLGDLGVSDNPVCVQVLGAPNLELHDTALVVDPAVYTTQRKMIESVKHQW